MPDRWLSCSGTPNLQAVEKFWIDKAHKRNCKRNRNYTSSHKLWISGKHRLHLELARTRLGRRTRSCPMCSILWPHTIQVGHRLCKRGSLTQSTWRRVWREIQTSKTLAAGITFSGISLRTSYCLRTSIRTLLEHKRITILISRRCLGALKSSNPTLIRRSEAEIFSGRMTKNFRQCR